MKSLGVRSEPGKDNLQLLDGLLIQAKASQRLNFLVMNIMLEIYGCPHVHGVI